MPSKPDPKKVMDAISEMMKRWDSASLDLMIAIQVCKPVKGKPVLETMEKCGGELDRAKASRDRMGAAIKQVEKLLAGLDKKSSLAKLARQAVSMAKSAEMDLVKQSHDAKKLLDAHREKLKKVVHD